ncbi:MAG: hypothetical protein V3U11_11710, partial [Planctomycetota bacterium]
MRMRFTSCFLTSVVMPLSGGALAAQDEPAPDPSPRVVVVPIEGQVNSSTVILTRRALKEAKALGVSHVIFRFDTPGGLASSMREVKSIVRAMDDYGITPLAFVEHRALSAGAFLAMACSEIYMRPGTEIGDATPIQIGPLGVRDIPKDARRKVISAFQAEARSVLELRGTLSTQTRLVVEAFVDPDLETFQVSYEEGGLEVPFELVDRAGLEALQQKQGVTFVGDPQALPRPLTLTAEEAERVGLARSIVDSLQALVEDELNLSMNQVGHLQPSWADNLANWLN